MAPAEVASAPRPLRPPGRVQEESSTRSPPSGLAGIRPAPRSILGRAAIQARRRSGATREYNESCPERGGGYFRPPPSPNKGLTEGIRQRWLNRPKPPVSWEAARLTE